MPYAPQERSPIPERLGMYLLGLAIGCVILGLIFAMRPQAMRSTPPQGPPATGP